MLALLLGAGFSSWAAGLPVASQLFDFGLEPFGVREAQRLERVKTLKGKWDALHPAGLTEQFVASALASGIPRDREDVLWYVVRRLSEPYIWQEWRSGRVRRHVLMIDENRKWEKAGVLKAADFLVRCGKRLSGVVTLNYDLLVEYALGSNGFNYGVRGEALIGRGPYPVSQWRKPVSLVGPVALAKLHGSISWDSAGRYTDGRRGLSGKALIVAPTPEKSPPEALLDAWGLSEQVLTSARSLLVFGFAFNPYDEAVLAHLRAAGKNLRSIALVDLASREDSARALWPHANISSFRPPPEDDGRIAKWLRQH